MSRDDAKKDRDETDETDEAEAVEKVEAAPDATDDDDEDRDASTRGIAEAMGIDEGEAEPGVAAEGEAEKAGEAAPPNRQARRRDQATQRRKKRAKKASEDGVAEVAEGEAVAATDGELPRDKNARAKELLKRRQQSVAAAKRGGGPSGLDTGEMVQDALVRGSSAATGFIRNNARTLLGVLIVAALGFGGFIFLKDRKAEQMGAATGALTDALASDRGRVLKEDKRSDEEKLADPTRVFPTSEARAQAAVEGYEKAVAATSEPGPNTLAKLGLAGASLEKGDLQNAIDNYEAVLRTPLAAADLDVKGRAIEGTGLALEQKGDLDAALKSYEELAKIDAKGFEELGLYHQARVHAHKGDKEKAKELLKKAREKLQLPSEAGQAFPFLEAVVDGDLRSLDPSAVPAARVQMGGGAKGSTMSPEDMERIQEQLKKLMQKNKGADGEPDDHEGEGMPTPGRGLGMPKQEEPQ